MPIYLRQSTASQEVPLGYFLDSTDGDTEETGLTIANTDIKIWKTGATTLANKNSGGATHISNGIFYAVLDAIDSNTIGPMVIFVHVAGALAIRVECCVLDEAVYDVLFGTTALATVSNITSGTITTATNVTTVNGLAANVITAASIASGALTAAKFAAGAFDAVWTVASRTLTAFSTTLALSVWHVLESAVVTASTIGLKVKNNLDAAITSRSSHSAADVWASGTRTLTSGANIALAKGVGVTGFNDLSAAQVNAEVDTALSDIKLQYLVNTALPTNWATDVTANSALDYMADDGTAVYDRTTDSLQAIGDSGGGGLTQQQVRDALKLAPTAGAPSAGSVDEHLDDILTDTAEIGAAGAGLTSVGLATNAVDADALATDAVTEITDAMKTALGITTGTADSGTTTTLVDAALTQADTDYWKGAVVVFTSGTLAGQARLVIGFTPATDTLTFYPATTVTVATQNYLLLPRSVVDVGRWDGGAVSALATAAGIADAVHDEILTDHITAGSLGKVVSDNLNATVSSRATQTSVDTVDANVDAILVDTGTTLQAELDGIQADTEDIQAKLGTPSDFGSGTSTIAANLQDIADNGTATFDRSTDSLQALRDRGDAAWITATGFSTLDAAGVRSAVGLASANLDTQLSTIDANVDSILVDTTEIGVAGAGLTNINLPDQTMNITGNLSGSVGSVTGNVGGDIVGNLQGNVQGEVASIGTAGIASTALAASALNAIADAFLDRNMAAGTDNGTDSTTFRTPRQALRYLRNKVTVSGGVATVTKENDSTTSWTAAVTTAAGDPISGVDPT